MLFHHSVNGTCRNRTLVPQALEKMLTTTEIATHLQNSTQNLTPGDSVEVVFTLGVTGVGKPTLTFLMTDNELHIQNGSRN